MAIVKRESGAWKTVINKLKQEGIRVNTEHELLNLLDIEKGKYAESSRLFEQMRQEADKCCKDEIAQIFAKQESNLSLVRKEFSRKIRPIQDRIDVFEKEQDEVNARGFFYKLFHLLEIFKLSSKNKKMKRKLRKIILEKDNNLKELDSFFNRERLEANQRRDDVIYNLKKEIDGTKRRVTAIEETLKSNDYYGAVAELEMIDFLKKLPENYYVISDVSIRFNKMLYGEYIHSVQIDHVVVGPSGIFIIEVKNWSSQFISEGNFPDPYKQVKKNSNVCYTLLRNEFNVKTKEILACKNQIPPNKEEKYKFIAARHLNQVNNYILYFKDQVHDQKTVEQIVKFIEREINYAPFW